MKAVWSVLLVGIGSIILTLLLLALSVWVIVMMLMAMGVLPIK